MNMMRTANNELEDKITMLRADGSPGTPPPATIPLT